jgi:hypothetical protein
LECTRHLEGSGVASGVGLAEGLRQNIRLGVGDTRRVRQTRRCSLSREEITLFVPQNPVRFPCILTPKCEGMR